MKFALIAKTALLALSIAVLTPIASAGTIFSFSGTTTSGDLFSGLLNTTPDPTPGIFDIRGVSGSVTIQGVTQGINSAASAFDGPFVITYSKSGYFFFDNLLSTSGNPFDLAGALIILNDGTELNLYYNTSAVGTGMFFQNNNYNSAITSLTLNALPASAASVAPEPSSLVLLGTGVLGIVGAARRRFNVV